MRSNFFRERHLTGIRLNPTSGLLLVNQYYFLHEVQFSAAIEAAHFPAVETGLLKPTVSCHFYKNNPTSTPKFGENGSGTGINSRAGLPENVQVQYLQKIALRAENKAGPMRSNFFRERHLTGIRLNPTSGLLLVNQYYFLHEVQFSAAIEAAHFPAVETGLLKPTSQIHFHKNKRKKSKPTFWTACKM